MKGKWVSLLATASFTRLAYSWVTVSFFLSFLFKYRFLWLHWVSNAAWGSSSGPGIRLGPCSGSVISLLDPLSDPRGAKFCLSTFCLQLQRGRGRGP